MSQRKQVCLFGTSADPPTGKGGHLGIAQHLASMEFDEVRILPVYVHMFGSKRGKQASFEARIEMCRILFKDVPKVVVSEAERICCEKAAEGLEEQQKSSLRIGTADLLDMLINDEPDVDFTLAFGADTFIDLARGKWRRTEDVFQLVRYRMVVFRRISSSQQKNDNKDEDVVDVDNDDETDRVLSESIAKWNSIGGQQSPIRAIQIPTLTNVSSSAVRRSTRDETILKEMLTSGVMEYVQQNRMYSLSENGIE